MTSVKAADYLQDNRQLTKRTVPQITCVTIDRKAWQQTKTTEDNAANDNFTYVRKRCHQKTNLRRWTVRRQERNYTRIS